MIEQGSNLGKVPPEFNTSPSLRVMSEIGQFGYNTAVRMSMAAPQNHLRIYDAYSYDLLAEVTDQVGQNIVIGDAVIEAISYGEQKGGEVRTPTRVYYFANKDIMAIRIEGETIVVSGY